MVDVRAARHDAAVDDLRAAGERHVDVRPDAAGRRVGAGLIVTGAGLCR